MREECIIVKNMLASGVVKYGRFRLSSGKESSFYVDLREALGKPTLRSMLLSLLASRVAWLSSYIDVFAGVATGGIPWATMLALLYSKPLSYVRSTAKSHGLERVVEGASVAGRSVVLVDDVATTGSSLLRAIEAVRREGGFVGYAVVVFDRKEGAREALEKKRVKLLYALSTRELEECNTHPAARS